MRCLRVAQLSYAVDDMRTLIFAIFLIFSNFGFAETHQFYEFRSQISITKEVFDRWDSNLFTSENANLVSKNYGGAEPPTNIYRIIFWPVLPINTVRI